MVRSHLKLSIYDDDWWQTIGLSVMVCVINKINSFNAYVTFYVNLFICSLFIMLAIL